MPRIWKEHEDCGSCHGSGIVWKCENDSDVLIPDHWEEYCQDCPAGEKRSAADWGDDLEALEKLEGE